jgi:hypothetical protein
MQRPSFAHNREAWSSARTWHQSGQVISTGAELVRLPVPSGVRDDSFTVLVPPVHLCRGLGPVLQHRPGPLPISSCASATMPVARRTLRRAQQTCGSTGFLHREWRAAAARTGRWRPASTEVDVPCCQSGLTTSSTGRPVGVDGRRNVLAPVSGHHHDPGHSCLEQHFDRAVEKGHDPPQHGRLE